ncbi:MAG TPA: biotin--[acetyl-CoA-carboxylase] ligase [Candidatus Udaeobacter sp.]|jgi:BirA family biotin operon repressor/biotin-[acetyl-CoA-carboxylase] ligase|nr:biotin--[acetyl-CoA-carboxylase] ligase [Candidatus Udaeobacter sp.]
MSTVEKLDRLIADQLRAKLPRGAVIGRQIVVLEQTGSTNDAILQIASPQGAAVSSPPPLTDEGLVVFAEHQTAGRGQRGNRWESTAGKCLSFSILLRPNIQLSDSGRLTIWAIEAVSDMIRIEFGLEPAIKLPNDVQFNGRKVAGVLVEMRAQNKAPHLAVVGIGINVNQSRDDFPTELQDRATALAITLGRQVDRQKFAVALLRNLDLTYREEFSKSVPAFNSPPVPTTRRDKRAAKSPTV